MLIPMNEKKNVIRWAEMHPPPPPQMHHWVYNVFTKRIACRRRLLNMNITMFQFIA